LRVEAEALVELERRAGAETADELADAGVDALVEGFMCSAVTAQRAS